MRLALVSDVHGNLRGLESCLFELRNRGADAIAFLGDLVMTGPHPAECLALMREQKPLAWIKGNTEGWLEEVGPDFVPANPREEAVLALLEFARKRLSSDEEAFLKSLPCSRVLELEGRRLLFCHGDPDSYSNAILPETAPETLASIAASRDFDDLASGHTHRAHSLSVRGRRFINPGALSMVPGGGDIGFAILDLGRNADLSFHRLPFDIDSYLSELAAIGFPGEAWVRKGWGR